MPLPAIPALLAGAGGSAAMGALITLLERLFRKGGRRQIGKAFRGGSVGGAARKLLGKRTAAGAATFAAFDIASSFLMGEGSPEEELQAGNKELLGFDSQDVSLGGAQEPGLEELLSLLSQSGAEDSSGLFI